MKRMRGAVRKPLPSGLQQQQQQAVAVAAAATVVSVSVVEEVVLNVEAHARAIASVAQQAIFLAYEANQWCSAEALIQRPAQQQQQQQQ
jgi:hypothetical protein